MKTWSEFVTLRERCWPGYKSVPGKKAYSPGSCRKEDVSESAAAAIAAATAIAKKKSGNYDSEGFRKTSYKNPDHPSVKSNTERKKEMNEDLRKWFSKTDPAGDWKRINSKGEAIGPCAREPGEPKPKCMSRAKRESLTKKERASAVAAKRKHDPNPERKGEPINVSNFGKGKISENMENLNEKNVPTNPELWSRAKSLARSKFDVYPSAYANGWASKWYKGKGGGWKSVSEDVESLEEGRPSQRHPLEGHEYHKKSNAELEYIAKDAHKAAEAMKSHNTTAENKYRDQANDSATVRHFRKTSGMPDWYKKKYGHMKEDIVNEVMDEPNYKLSIQARQAAADKSSTALKGLVAKKNLKQTEGKNKSQAFIDKMTSKVNAAKRLKEEDAYDKDAKPSDKPHDKEAAAKRAKIAAVMARRKMAKEEAELEEGIKSKIAGVALSALAAHGAAHGRVTPDGQGGFTGGFKASPTVTAPASTPAAEAPKGFSREYLQGVVDGKHPRPLLSKEKAAEHLKNMKEEVEQIDELSPSTLQSYKVAGHKKYDSIRNNTDADSMAKKSKLEKGIKDAHAKQYPSKPATPAPKKDPNSRGYEQGRYMGDSVEQDNENRIDELSNDMLGRYKTAAGADASKADKAGNYNKGNKRFSGIMKATKKQMANDIITRASSVTEAKEKTEYDYEGDMARGQLQSIINNAQRVHDMLEDNDNLPEWVQSKITLAEDYISTVANYLMSEIDEEVDKSPPFDGPYTKDKGTVTDKSGAKHTPMSRARNLARQAMKKQSDSLKAPSRLGEESSRKAEIVKAAVKKKKMNSKEDTFQSQPEISTTITKNY